MGENVGLGLNEALNEVTLTSKIWSQNLNDELRVIFLYDFDGPSEVISPLIGQVVAIDTCQNHIFESHLRNRKTDFIWFLIIDFALGVSSLNVAKAAPARADFTHQHKSSSAATPTLTDVGTTRLLTNRREL
jgi:hypothetical protein